MSKYFDLSIAGIIGLNVITMALEYHLMPRASTSRIINPVAVSAWSIRYKGRSTYLMHENRLLLLMLLLLWRWVTVSKGFAQGTCSVTVLEKDRTRTLCVTRRVLTAQPTGYPVTKRKRTLVNVSSAWMLVLCAEISIWCQTYRYILLWLWILYKVLES